jgi:putative restriction endonuclease
MAWSEDAEIRLAAVDFVKDLQLLHGVTVPHAALVLGFEFHGTRVPMMGPQGIFTPKACSYPISITTVPAKPGKDRPYDDHLRDDGYLDYRYRRGGADHRDNVGLRRAMRDKVPVFYFLGIVPGQYVAAWPTFIVEDHRDRQTFTVQVDDAAALGVQEFERVAESEVHARRSYVTRTVVQRVHQTEFRERVLRAYRQSCAICRLRHRQLLDAAHIIPDKDPRGLPLVSNGLALCKLHHAAFDRRFIARVIHERTSASAIAA